MLKRSSFSNYETNILSTIQLNLDNYKYGSGFTILKELIQNASDANATKIVIRSFTAVPNAHCPLLKRAGIVVYNNGKFDEDDAKNIAMFGGDNKKNDATTIGRYGFGLKSIYHLCDAFIYYGHKDKLINGLSPLKGKDDDGNSGEFADLTEDDEKALVEQFEKEQDGLSFFIPVDGKNKIGSEPVDPKHPFNRNEKGCSELIQNIILTFAILSKSSKGTKLKEFRYDLGDCNILLNVNENNCRLSLNFQDEIVVPFSSLRDVVGESIFANEEQKRVVNELARRLAKCDYEGSLKTKKKNVDFGKSINELAEERLRGTTVLQLLRIPRIVQDEKINLRLSFASYLPLPKQEKIGEIKRIDCDFNYAVIIHAPFAIDSGRKNIYKFDTICHHRVEMNDFENVEYSLDEEKPLHRWWNRILFQSILAPSLPSLLDKALKDGVLLEQDVKDVGKKLYDLLQQGEDGEKRRLEYVNTKNVFVRRINAGGVKEWILLQVERGGRYIHIPETDDSKLLNWLTKMAGSMDVLLLTDTVSTLPPTIKFDLNAFEQLLATIPSELFEDELIIEFLHKLILINGINKTRLHSDLNLKNCIRTAILRALANLGVVKVMTSINKIKDLCSVIEFYEIQNIDILDDEWTYLWEKDNPFILLPSQTLVHNNCNIEYDFDEFLYFLCICAEENKLSGKAQLSVIQAIAGDSIKSVLSKIERDYRSNLKVFKVQKIQYDRGKNILNNTIDFLDYNAVLKINLFREFDFSDSSHIICKLVKLIENENLYMVENADVNRSAFLNKFARSANKAGALDYLKEKYQQYLAISNDEDIRKDFLESIFDRNSLLENIRPEYSGIYTFLLMGFKETQSKICILKPNCSEVWKKIYEDCLKKDNKAIELLTLSENQKKFVENHNTLLKNITWLDNNECQEMLVHFSQGNNLDFMKTEYYQNESNRKQIFEVINEPKRNLYYRIPLHKNEKGEFVSFVPGSTWYNKHNIEFEVDVPSLEGKIIPCEKDDLLRSKQDSFFISDSDRNRYEILTQGAALREFLISYKFEPRILRNCCDWILERMQRYVTFSDKELSQIDSICWIPLKNSENLCSIKDILTTDRCSQESFAILKESLNFILLEDVDINDDKKKYITGFLKRRNLDLIDEINVRIQEKYSNYYFPIEDKDEKQRIFNLAINNLTQKNKILKIYAVIGSDSKLKISKEELLKNYCQLRIPGAFDYENGIELLNTLTENTRCEDDALKLFNHILKLIKDNPNFKLSDIRRFPNAENELEREWKLATELIAVPQCSDSHSIGQKLYKRDNLCSSETYDLISNYIPQNDMVQRLPKATDAEIKEVVDFWRQNCKQPKLVSLALYLMQGKFRRMAGALEDSILGKLDEFCRDEFTIPSSHVNKLFPTEESKRNRFRTFDEINVTANVISQSTNKAMSLAGTCEEFPINPKVTYDPNVNLDLISKTFNVRLLKSSGINTDESIKCLIETLLWNIYKIDVKKAFLLKNEFFKLIDETSQYTIKAAQKHIRREIFSTLHFLNVKHKEYKRLNNEINRLDNKDENSESESQKEWNLRNEMLETVIREPDLQRYIFDRVCHKIKEHQYFSSSILFELFQNADDCVNDFLKAPEDIALKYADKKKFEVHFDPIAKRLEIIHYGRKINQSFPEVDDDIANSFKRDLQNMLSIASSEKSQENGQTGKFGLGFKSVYTVCDEPVVRSGDLQFKIIAGIYPDENIEYDKTCDDCTKIELKCRDDIDVENDCFAEFEKCAAFLTVFSKQINEIYLLDKVIEPEYQNVCELLKSETAIKKVKLNGEVFLLVDHRDCEVPFKMLFKELDGILVNLTECDSWHPRVWHLTPLEASETLPFIINADFEIDTGRKNLAAGNKKNETLMKKIANCFFVILQEMISTSDSYQKYAYDIATLLLKTRNTNDKYFAPFAENILQKLFRQEKILVSGYGPVTKFEDRIRLFSVAASNYTDGDDSKLLNAFQNILAINKCDAFVMTHLASESYLSEFGSLIEINKMELADLFAEIKNKTLTVDLLDNIILIESILKPNVKPSFWEDFNKIDFNIKSSDGLVVAIRELYEVNGTSVWLAKEKIDLSYYTSNSIAFFEKNNLLNNLRTASNYWTPTPINVLSEPSQEENIYYSEDDLKNCRELTESELLQLLSEKESLVALYYEKLYSSDFFDHEKLRFRNSLILDESSDDLKMTKEWCILMLYGMCQSLPYYNHQEVSLKKAIQFLNENGFIDDFCNKVNLQDIRDRFNKETHSEECYLRPFEMMLRLRRFQKRFIDFYTVVRQLPLREHFENIAVLLYPSMDSELSGTDIDYATMNRSFKLGIHFVLRELLRSGFWVDGEDAVEPEKLEQIKLQTFMPRQKICKMLGLDCKNASSVRIFRKIGEMLPDHNTMDDTFDILFIEKEF